MTPYDAIEILIGSDPACAALLTGPDGLLRLDRPFLRPDINLADGPAAHYRAVPAPGQGHTLSGLDGLEKLSIEISGWGLTQAAAQNVCDTIRALLDPDTHPGPRSIPHPSGGAGRVLQGAQCQAPFDFGDPTPRTFRSVMMVDLWFTAL